MTNPPRYDRTDWLDPAVLSKHVHAKHILVGVCGGIAAYKTCTLVSRLAQAGAEVTVVMTEGGTRFVTPLTFQALSGRAVHTSVWQHHTSGSPQHIALGDAVDTAIVAPCTMNTLANLVGGHAGDAVTTALAAIDRATTPVLLAPAMNDTMWRQPATQRNLQQAEGDGFRIVSPGEGWQACRHDGTGRMAEPAQLAQAIVEALKSQ